MTTTDKINGMLLGLAAGDALGVPVEFCSRYERQQDPVSDLRSYGTHYQPAGTWSDDASLTFCLAEAMLAGEDGLTDRLAINMTQWLQTGYWTPHGRVFDVGIGTRQAINRLATGTPPELAGGLFENDNGNGSLMRILPLLLLIIDKPIGERFTWVRRVSSLTHGHIRSVMACFYYLELAKFVWQGLPKSDAYAAANKLVAPFWVAASLADTEQVLFSRLLTGKLGALPERVIQSGGYVMHTLEASVWCWLTTNSYEDAVLKAVNLGDDTDTTGAVTGGLAGLYYGPKQIPAIWISALARLDSIEKLSAQLAGVFH